MMKILQMMILSVCLALGSIACSSNSGNPTASEGNHNSLRTSNPSLTPAQKKAWQHLHYIRREFYLDNQRRRIEERDVLDVRNNEQLEALDNLQWLYHYIENQRRQRKTYRSLGSEIL